MKNTEKTWATRKIARNVARARMRQSGVTHPNKTQYGRRSGHIVNLGSYFASHWREVAAK